MSEDQKMAQRQVIACLYFICGKLKEEAAISPIKIGQILAFSSGGIAGAADQLRQLI